MTVNEEKNIIRNEMKKRRSELSAASISETAGKVFSILTQASWGDPKELSGKTVMSYMSFKNEFPTEELNLSLLDAGCDLVLPYTDSSMNVTAFHVRSLDELLTSELGIREPDPETAEICAAKDADIILLPGLAFDLSGNRIGFGAGCYDRFLADKGDDVILTGLAYSFQVLERIPSYEDDIPCDYILTEKGILKCSR